MYRKLTTAAAVAALTLGLAACGGGGSSPTTSTTPTTTPDTDTTPVAVTLPSDGDNYLTDDEKALEDGTASLTTGGTTDVGPYTLTCVAGPCAITVEGGEVTATGEVTAAYSTAAMTTIDAGKMMAAAETEGRATGLLSALTDVTGDPQPTIISASDANTKGGDFEIMRGPSGGAVVTDGPLGGKSRTDVGMADSAVSGFEGTKLSYKSEKWVVYTDIDAAKRKAYSKVYGATDTPGIGDGIAFVAAATGVPAHITLTDVAMKAAGEAGLLDASKFPQPKAEGGGTNTYTYDGMEGAGKKRSSFAGTFHGASGTYTCGTSPGTPATTCTATVTAPSSTSHPAYTFSAEGWSFTPATDHDPQIIEQDADHMHFGWWVKTPAKANVGGEFLYNAEMFYSGSMPYDVTNIVQLHGDADYSGPAAGLFAVTGDNAAHGEFTATAKLTAKFGIAGSTSGGSVSGNIADFVRDDGVDNGWTVTLGSAAIGTTAGGGGNGSVTGGANDNIGAWEFQMYGSNMNNANPTGIAGSFRAAIDANTAVAGAFATKPN